MPSRNGPIAVVPSLQQFGIGAARGSKLSGILAAIQIRVVAIGARAVDELPAGARVGVGLPRRSGEDVPLANPAMPRPAGVRDDNHSRLHWRRSAQAGAQKVNRRRVGILARLVNRDQGVALALELARSRQRPQAGRAATSRRWGSAKGGSPRCRRRRDSRARTPRASPVQNRQCLETSDGRRASEPGCRRSRCGGGTERRAHRTCRHRDRRRGIGRSPREY